MEALPLVGLPARMDPEGCLQYLNRQYIDAISTSGGNPVIIPLLERPERVRQFAEQLDGIVLTGSHSDVDPRHYHATRQDACGPSQPLRDVTDFLLLDVALERKTPVLAICFGMQTLNVFMGGSLLQDIPSLLRTPIEHSEWKSEGWAAHEIEIAPQSILEELAGGVAATVNSSHHQAVDRVGRDLNVVARAPDDVIESVFGTMTGCWILGVQWHPEKSFALDAFSRNIFDRFLAQCRGR